MQKILTKLLFYTLLIPLSLLPLRVLYIMSDILAVILRDLVKYRKKVVTQNLQNSFPNFNSREIDKITRQFYSHLADILVEAIKMLTISRKNVLKHYKCLNADKLIPYFEKKQSVILVSAHYNNWEYMVLSLGMQFSHHGIGVGKAMSNKTFEILMHKKRTRYGTEVVYTKNVRDAFEKYNIEQKSCAYMQLFDQSPNNIKRSYITDFLNQKTAVIYGQEYFAKKYNFPILFYSVRKIRRGYYQFELEHITDTPTETPYGFITEQCLSFTTSLIQEAPQYWLWSHKRWKHKILDSSFVNTFEPPRKLSKPM
jgi:KDO2-lipid IV(A) lauroyltransferase